MQLDFRDWLDEHVAIDRDGRALARRWVAAIPRAVEWVRERILPPSAVASYAMAEGSTSLWDPNRTLPPDQAAEIEAGGAGLGHRRLPRPDDERGPATNFEPGQQVYTGDNLPLPGGSDEPATKLPPHQAWRRRADEPGHVLGDLTHRTFSTEVPSNRMRRMETLWATMNHRLHDWMQGHGAYPLSTCNLCDGDFTPTPLGSGVFGHAFRVGDEVVLKVTSDQSEAALSWRVKEAGLEEAMVIDVRRLANYSIKRGDVFGILQHLGNNQLPKALKKASYLMLAFMRYYMGDVPKVWKEPGLEDKVRNALPIFGNRFAPEVMDAPDDETFEWIKFLITVITKIMNVSGAIWTDSHANNLMMDKWGKARAIDLGQWVLTDEADGLGTDDIPTV